MGTRLLKDAKRGTRLIYFGPQEKNEVLEVAIPQSSL